MGAAPPAYPCLPGSYDDHTTGCRARAGSPGVLPESKGSRHNGRRPSSLALPRHSHINRGGQKRQETRVKALGIAMPVTSWEVTLDCVVSWNLQGCWGQSQWWRVDSSHPVESWPWAPVPLTGASEGLEMCSVGSISLRGWGGKHGAVNGLAALRLNTFRRVWPSRDKAPVTAFQDSGP